MPSATPIRYLAALQHHVANAQHAADLRSLVAVRENARQASSEDRHMDALASLTDLIQETILHLPAEDVTDAAIQVEILRALADCGSFPDTAEGRYMSQRRNQLHRIALESVYAAVARGLDLSGLTLWSQGMPGPSVTMADVGRGGEQ